MTKSCVSRATLLASALLCVATALADSCGSSTIKNYTRRSDSRAKYRQWVGNVSGIKIDRFEAESWYGIVSLTPGFAGTFKSDNIAECLFGSCCCCDDCCSGRTIKVQGSAVENRDSQAWLADYFYLPRNYSGCFSVDPRIRTFFMDIDWYLGMDQWVSGMYWRMYGTVVHTSWDLNFCDRGHTTGDEFLDHSCGYFSPKRYEKEKLLQCFKDYACGGVPAASDENENEIVWNGLKYIRMTNCAQKDTGFADLRFELGWNFLNCEDYHLGVNIQGAAPTGSREKSCYLFSPMIGNGGHGELGAGLHGHYVFWRGEEDDRSCRFLLDVNVTHLFKKCQCRTFDLACKPNSAYMLAAKFEDNPAIEPAQLPAATQLTDAQIGWRSTGSTAPVDPTAAPTVDLPNPNRRFAGEYTPVANLSTVNVDVSVGAQVDLVAMFNYTCGNFSWDLGYDFWALTCQKYDCVKSCCNGDLCDCNASTNTWALKGDARMFGFQAADLDSQVVPALVPVPLSATQCSATIFTGTNKVAPANLAEKSLANAVGKDINTNVDSANYAFIKTPTDQANGYVGPLGFSCETSRYTAAGNDSYLSLVDAGDQIKTSSKPQFLNCNSLSMARTKGLSHTLFTHLSWTWDREDWTPYLGVGACVEFGQSCSDCGDCCDPCCGTSCCPTTSTTSTSSNCCSTNCCDPCCCDGPCLTCATSEWRVWVKGGLVYGSCA